MCKWRKEVSARPEDPPELDEQFEEAIAQYKIREQDRMKVAFPALIIHLSHAIILTGI